MSKMGKKRKETTPLKQMKISSFFVKGVENSVKKMKPDTPESPDVILCTPPRLTIPRAKRSLGATFKKSQDTSTKKNTSASSLAVFRNMTKSTTVAQLNKSCSSITRKSETNSIELPDSGIGENTPNLLEADSEIQVLSPPSKIPKKSMKNSITNEGTPDTTISKLSVKKLPAKTTIGDSTANNLSMEIVDFESDEGWETEKLSDKHKTVAVSPKSLNRANSSLQRSIVEQRPVNDSCKNGKESNSVGAGLEMSENTAPASSEGFSEMKIFSPVKTPRKILGQSAAENTLMDIEDFDFDDAWSQKSSGKSQQFTLTFDRCRSIEVISSETRKNGLYFEQILCVKDKHSSEMGQCTLRDMWAVNLELSPGYSANILANFENSEWVVDSKQGYVCLFPELLVSSTSLVGAMYCRRRGILTNLFRGLDSDNKIMTIGNLVHELLQKSLECHILSEDALLKVIDDLLEIPANLRVLYSCGMSLDDTKTELGKFVPFVIRFMKTYVTQEEKPQGKNYKGAITEIKEIEENVSSRNMGIKGRIDVTVRVKTSDKKLKLMPLELKTGRASFSNEHRSQVILYTMMMSDLGEKVESGLLLYLKEGIMEEIKPTYVEIRDLILLRNDFAQYLRKFDQSNLPEPIRLANSCSRCPYLTVCTAYLDETTGPNHAIRSVAPEIKDTHLTYFHKWTKLVLLEEENVDVDSLKISGLVYQDVKRLKDGYVYKFVKDDNETSLTVGNVVYLRSDNRSYMGRIIKLSSDHCSILLDKTLDSNIGFFTAEGFKSSMATRFFTNLGHLLEEPFASLRRVVIDQEPARFDETLPKSYLTEHCMEILSALNSEQRRAVLKMLTCQNYFSIEGPPGTGKTQTIIAMIRVFIYLGQRVLLVGHTHSSVDNVLSRISDVDFLRMGSLASIQESLHAKSYGSLISNVKTPQDIELMFSKPLIASTCLGLDADIVAKIRFDVCIVDESSQVLQPEVLKPLFTADKFVLIGDSKQLRPVVKNPEAKRQGMDVSIFEWLENTSGKDTLTKQYRMNRTIMDLVNMFTYDGVLICGSDSVAVNTLKLQNSEKITSRWLNTALSDKLEKSVTFLNTAEYLKLHPSNSFYCSNKIEASIVKELVQMLLLCGISPCDIGVIAPFRAQIQILSEMMPPLVEVNTVDQYQGRDKDVIIFSCTKQNRSQDKRSEFEILNDHRRLTVAISRAKVKLIMVGDKETLKGYDTFHTLFGLIDEANVFALKDGTDDFMWNLYEL